MMGLSGERAREVRGPGKRGAAMQIEPTSAKLTIRPTDCSTERCPAPRPADSGNVGEAGVFAPTADYTRLLRGVREQPEVRTEVVADVARRLAAGKLNGLEVARETAQAIDEIAGG